MNDVISSALANRHRNLIRLAYRLWHEAGRPAAPYTRFWVEAERRILAGAASASTSASDLNFHPDPAPLTETERGVVEASPVTVT